MIATRCVLLAPALGAFLTACQSEPPPRLIDAEPSDGRDAFFEALDTGDYQQLDDIITTLTREHNDGDDHSTAVLAFAHAWRMSESPRDPGNPRVVEHADSAVRYFEEAIERFPEDPRLLGFLGGFRQAVGTIHDEPNLRRKGWFEIAKSARQWPEWGLFTRAYVATQMDPSERRYKKALKFYWKNLDKCIEDKVDRDDFDFKAWHEASMADDDPWNWRACHNTDVAPHNVEGFFMAFGDMLAKGGDERNARIMYQAALEVPEADEWPYRHIAEARLENLAELEGWFNEEIDRSEEIDSNRVTMIQGAYGCTGCHQGQPSPKLSEAMSPE